ncbi:MAG TPA: DMT family transporter [Xanthobacteraceae bacterium]|nr:DMT family transporter [Xanthobacteraceae bacterium]
MPSINVRERLHALGPGLIAATSFGICDTLAKLILAGGVDALTLALIRGVVGLGVMILYLRVGEPAVPHTPRARAFALALGVLFAAIVFGLFKAIDLTTVPVAVLIYFVYPLLTGIGGAIFGVERLGWRGIAAALAAFCGLALMIGAYPQHLSVAGIGFALGAAVCRATFLLVARVELQKSDPRLTTWHSLVSSTLVFAVAAAATMNWNSPHTAGGWVLVLILSIGVALATLTLYISTVRIGPFRSALIMNLEPLLATLLSAVLLGEVITPLQALGAAVMLAALVVFQLRR